MGNYCNRIVELYYPDVTEGPARSSRGRYNWIGFFEPPWIGGPQNKIFSDEEKNNSVEYREKRLNQYLCQQHKAGWNNGKLL